VFDLPLVCDVGLSHIRSEPEATRVSFVKGDALTDPLPGGFDLVMFKSMLHDWPEKEARMLIVRGAQALKPGGTLLIFERAPFDTEKGELPYSAIPMLLFLHAFRGPAFYQDQMGSLGFEGIVVKQLDLEMPFFSLRHQERTTEGKSSSYRLDLESKQKGSWLIIFLGSWLSNNAPSGRITIALDFTINLPLF
jgi:SAM-dependent methyltransferase